MFYPKSSFDFLSDDNDRSALLLGSILSALFLSECKDMNDVKVRKAAFFAAILSIAYAGISGAGPAPDGPYR